MARTLVGGSGWLLPAPVSPMWAIARVPLSNPDAALELSRLIAAPGTSPFAPADRRWPGRSGAPARATAWAPRRRRERPRGAALKPYRKFSHGIAEV